MYIHIHMYTYTYKKGIGKRNKTDGILNLNLTILMLQEEYIIFKKIINQGHKKKNVRSHIFHTCPVWVFWRRRSLARFRHSVVCCSVYKCMCVCVCMQWVSVQVCVYVCACMRICTEYINRMSARRKTGQSTCVQVMQLNLCICMSAYLYICRQIYIHRYTDTLIYIHRYTQMRL